VISHNYFKLIPFFVSAFALLIFGAAWCPAGWNWGFHFLAFYGFEVKIIIPLLMILVTIPRLQDILITLVSSFTHWFYKQYRGVRIIIPLTALCGLAFLFWAFRTRSYLLGDGQLLLRNLPYIDSVNTLAVEFKREPLVGFCIVIITNFFIVLKSANPTLDAYTWLSIVSGIVFVILIWRLVLYYTQDRIEQYLLFLLLMSTGVSQLFFGYVENYAPSAAGILLFILVGIAYLREKISIVWPIGIYGIDLMFNFGVLIFIPALILLLSTAIKRKQVAELAASLFLTSAIIFGLLQLSLFPFEFLKDVLGGTGQHIVPFSSPLHKNQAYTFFSLSHSLDVVNLFCLNYPATTILLLLSSIMMWRQRKSIIMETGFLLLTAFGGFVFILIFNCELGMSRDWDILASLSLGIPIAALALWKTIDYEQKFRYRILIMLGVVSLLQTSLWVGINAEEMKSEKRFAMLEDDQLWSKLAHLDFYEELAIYHRERGEYEKAIQYYQKYVTRDSTNERLWRKLADVLQLAGDQKEAVNVYKTMIRLGMRNYQILSNLGLLLTYEGNYSEAMILYRRAEEDAPTDPIIKYNIGRTIMENEHAYKKAIPYFLHAIQLDSTFSQAYYKVIECYFMVSDSVKANQFIVQLQRLSR
jgi:Tfp pilus assembly protein PilF